MKFIKININFHFDMKILLYIGNSLGVSNYLPTYYKVKLIFTERLFLHILDIVQLDATQLLKY